MKAAVTTPIARYDTVEPMFTENRPIPANMIKIRTAIIAVLFISSVLIKLLAKGLVYSNYNRIAKYRRRNIYYVSGMKDLINDQSPSKRQKAVMLRLFLP